MKSRYLKFLLVVAFLTFIGSMIYIVFKDNQADAQHTSPPIKEKPRSVKPLQ
jgi:hypothetical protein